MFEPYVVVPARQYLLVLIVAFKVIGDGVTQSSHHLERPYHTVPLTVLSNTCQQQCVLLLQGMKNIICK